MWNRLRSTTKLAITIVLLGGSSLQDVCAAAEYDVEPVYDVLVPMRDGKKLPADIYFPAKNGHRVSDPLPAVLTRTPQSWRQLAFWHSLASIKR